MKKFHNSSLFLIEILMSILILSISSVACIHVFSISYELRRDAHDYSSAKKLFSDAAEELSSYEDIHDYLLEHKQTSSGTIRTYYSNNLLPCKKADASYITQIQIKPDDTRSIATIDIINTKTEKTICSKEVYFPKQLCLPSEVDS